MVDTAAVWEQGTLGLVATTRPQVLTTATVMAVFPILDRLWGRAPSLLLKGSLDMALRRRARPTGT